MLVAELRALLQDAELYERLSEPEQIAYLRKAAEILHRVVDATGDESSRWIAQDAADRADRAAGASDLEGLL